MAVGVLIPPCKLSIPSPFLIRYLFLGVFHFTPAYAFCGTVARLAVQLLCLSALLMYSGFGRLAVYRPLVCIHMLCGYILGLQPGVALPAILLHSIHVFRQLYLLCVVLVCPK